MSLSTPAPAARTLHFPEGPTSAKLTLSGDALDPSRQEREAVGTIEVPAGVTAMLEVGSDELDVLSRLATGDLDYLTVTDPVSGLAAALEPLGAVKLVLAGECQPAAITELAGLTDLTDLTVSGPLDATFAGAVAGLTQLTSLRVNGDICSAVAAASCGLTGLTSLVVNSEVPIAEGLTDLGGLTAMEKMFLIGPDIDDRVLARMPPLPSLVMLALGGPELHGEGIESLTRLPALDILIIYGSGFEIQRLPGLAGSPSLTMLLLRDIPDVDDQSVPYLATLSPPLREIRIQAQGKDELSTFSLSAKVWLSRVRPDLSLNGFSATPKAIEKYVAKGLGADPRTGEMELTS